MVPKKSLKRSIKNRGGATAKITSKARRGTALHRANWTHDDDLIQRILEHGELVAYQDWDSGGPGAGAGRDGVYRYGRKFCVLHDAGLSGPFTSIVKALKEGEIDVINGATRRVWHRGKGVTFDRQAKSESYPSGGRKSGV